MFEGCLLKNSWKKTFSHSFIYVKRVKRKVDIQSLCTRQSAAKRNFFHTIRYANAMVNVTFSIHSRVYSPNAHGIRLACTFRSFLYDYDENGPLRLVIMMWKKPPYIWNTSRILYSSSWLRNQCRISMGANVCAYGMNEHWMFGEAHFLEQRLLLSSMCGAECVCESKRERESAPH